MHIQVSQMHILASTSVPFRATTYGAIAKFSTNCDKRDHSVAYTVETVGIVTFFLSV